MNNIIGWEIESGFIDKGYKVICGVDEAGRGPLAGPVVAAAVVLPFGLSVEGLNDSKKLSNKQRISIRETIENRALAFSIALADIEEIEELNILQATMLAMRRAINGLSIKSDCVLIDGPYAKGFDIQAFPVVKGDALSASIAAASVLAKTERDHIMIELDKKYPGYGFAKHKGYGTKAHYAALASLGPCDIHRRGFRLI